MSERSTDYLKDRLSGELIEASLIDGVSRAEVEVAEAAWRPLVERKIEVLKKSGASLAEWPEHSHWDWRKKHQAVDGLIAYRMFGLECQNEMQGLMLVLTAGHSCRLPI